MLGDAVRGSRSRAKLATTLAAVSGWLTAHLSIMFVPAAVGLIDEGEALSRYGAGLAIATAASTILTMVVTVLVFRWALRRFAAETDAAE